jgi:hypothetical protein
MSTPPHTLMIRAMSPKTLVRYAATSKNAWNATSVERKRIGALKRVVRRLQARKKHIEYLGPRSRLSSPLFGNREEAIRRLSMSPGTLRAVKKSRTKREARFAYGRYVRGNGTWNQFVSVHVKAGGRGNINRLEARRMYN